MLDKRVGGGHGGGDGHGGGGGHKSSTMHSSKGGVVMMLSGDRISHLNMVRTSVSTSCKAHSQTLQPLSSASTQRYQFILGI